MYHFIASKCAADTFLLSLQLELHQICSVSRKYASTSNADNDFYGIKQLEMKQSALCHFNTFPRSHIRLIPSLPVHFLHIFIVRQRGDIAV